MTQRFEMNFSEIKALKRHWLFLYKTGITSMDWKEYLSGHITSGKAEKEINELLELIVGLPEKLNEIAQAVKENSGEGDTFKLSLYSVAVELEVLSSAIKAAQ